MRTRRAQSSVRWVLWAVGAILVLVVGVWVVLTVISPRVVVTEAVEGPIVQAFYSTGTIEPEREYPIKANGPGTVTEVRVDKGDRVKKGDVLAINSDPALQYQVDKSAAELREKLSKADLKQSPVIQEFDSKIVAYQELVEIGKREVARFSGLLEGKAGSQADVDAATDRLKKNWLELEALKSQRLAKLLELKKDVDVAQSALATAQWNLQQQTLKSPIDGVVLDRPMPVGTRAAVNDRIMSVANVSPASLVMRAAVDEEDVAKVKPEQVVRMTLYAFAGRAFEGRVTKIYDQADPDRRTFEVDVKLVDAEVRLQPGMTGELAFVMASKERGIVVPSQALQNGSVYVVRDGRMEKREVHVGLKSVERVEIESGLKLGERVAISPVNGDGDGQRVRPSYVDPIVAAGVNKTVVTEQAFKGFQ